MRSEKDSKRRLRSLSMLALSKKTWLTNIVMVKKANEKWRMHRLHRTQGIS